MKKIYLKDRSFKPYTVPIHTPAEMTWQRVKDDEDLSDKTVVFTNVELEKSLQLDVAKRIAWLWESRGIAWPTYEFIEDNLQRFDRIMTYDDSIAALDRERCVFVPRAGTWIKQPDIKIYQKSKFISYISSGKRFNQWSANGHGIRQNIYYLLTETGGSLGRLMTRCGVKKQIDCYGRITGTPLPYKLDSLKDYKFQIVVENMMHDSYFTEKILDCFATGTIPIYRGSHRVADFFDPDGIVFFDGLEALTDILCNLTEADYYRRLDAVHENFRRVHDWILVEDWLCRNTDFLEW